MSGSMRAAAAADPGFRGIDPAALGQLVKQLNAADRAIQGWLNAHPPPPGVAAEGYHRAQDAGVWVSEQISMLTRRYNYAITHPDPVGGVTPAPAPPPRRAVPPAPAPGGGGAGVRPGRPPVRTPPPATPRGAGPIGHYPDRRAAQRAARSDALVIGRAVEHREPIPDEVWKRLKANADDPDYTETLYERLGPAGTADLIRRAAGNDARLKVIQDSIGVASHHADLDAAWIRALLAEADRDGTRAAAVQVLTHAGVSRRTQAALVRLGLLPAGPTAPAAPRGPVEAVPFGSQPARR